MTIKATDYSSSTYAYPVGEREGSRKADDPTSTESSLRDLLKRNEQVRVALSELGRSSAQSAKEYARRRLEELEDMLRKLALLGLSPKQLAAMLKEVKGLVEQYQAAGKALGADVSIDSPTASGDTGNANNMAAAGDDASNAAAGANAASVNTSTPVTEATTGNPTTAGDAISPSGALSQAGAGGQASPASAYRAMADNLSRTNDAATADVNFMARAKSLQERLKSMLKHANEQGHSR
ncbi:hypothetical protein [Burkholderia ubonensis]|uniref:hypothetical protein n=1 Tax=Burkholderia ubonensis TaxID=101571 RepID=UPI000BA67F76|nr:hypothetical protein [Burkholderia ubonensis]PAJ86514.1 hypothetical protein CJO70_16835 [Burkholderia ubonensis]PAJ93648.1 hypothetical protein CJO69_15215 [Burkholderia ubonensis]PAK06846.1 hypothetical protein CJO67_16775 [Burkholderia ubonensis]RQP68910.1 hypothetical protein DF013_27285 [Burkholderia ubonensis]RQP75855.1 hypothetical protein DF014_26090 [Burkholderia ubonensis]